MKKKEEDKGKLDDMATKDSVKKDDEKKEEKPDTRAMYAKIAMVKNKLRSMGQANPMVMAVDACEQTTVTNDGSKLSDKHVPGGSNSQYNADGTKKTKKTEEEKYNPYGKGSNMNPTKASETTGP